MTAQAAPTSRQAILRAARRAFALHPYAEVTLRKVAADADVSASLIVKLFGSKEQLFDAVTDFSAAADELFAAPLDGLGRHLVLTLVGIRRREQTDPLLRVVFALGKEDELAVLRDRFRTQVTDRLAALLPGPDPVLRAELAVGQLLGLGATSSIHRDGGRSQEAAVDRIADLYGPCIQRLIDG